MWCEMKIPIGVLSIVLLTSALCSAQDRAISHIPISQHPDYSPYVRPALRSLVAQSGVNRRNHFYICRVEIFEGGYDHAWVYWRENRAIVLWEPFRGYNARGDSDQTYDLVFSRRYLRRDKDVVPTLEDVGGSSYLVTRQWWRETVRDCVQNGDRFVIYKRVRQHRRAQSNNGVQQTRRTAPPLSRVVLVARR
jgi:hypothetical protein